MGGSKSSSSSSQSQSTSTLADESLKEISSGGGGVQAVEFSNVNGIESPTVTINTDGLQGDDVIQLFDRFGVGVENIIGTINEQSTQAVQSITKIAESNTGTSSEAGNLVNKAIIPGMILLTIFILAKSKVFK